MDAYLEGLIKAQADAGSRIREIIDRAEGEKRALSPEENASLEEANAAYDVAKAEGDKIAAYKDRVAAAEQARAALQPVLDHMRENPTIASMELGPDGWIVRAAKSVLAGGAPQTLTSRRSSYEQRALSVGSQGAGTTFPISFMDSVHVFERTLNPMIDVATVIARSSGAPYQFPTVTADVTAGGSVTAEAGGITEGDPSISTPQINTFKIAHTTLYSAELEQDEVIGLDSLLGRLIARPIGLGWGTYFTLGTGTTQPFGFLNRATNAGTALGTANGTSQDKYFSPTDLVTLQYSLAAPYRVNGSWMTNSVAKMRSFKDAQGNFLWTASLTLGAPDSFLGRPVYENPAMAAAGSANTAIAFGDFSQYIVLDVPARIDISRDYKFNTDQLALRVVTRRGGDLIDTVAVKYLVSQAI